MPPSGQVMPVVGFYGPQAGAGHRGPTLGGFVHTGKRVKPETYNSGQSKGGQGGQQGGSGQQGSTGGR
ncbi:uncharacterized protein K444DRAFT_610510 [Hyaloscypha bicolor E]|uniref:Uncharacterized protein n=1 Tax=Hyaloscypha bicolor E TaxID=1095630 RepID=A0A2J6THD9_9HELO|nr:uncharacterized protein K444DRAFT_610510 [Hyaloscypha bicolor E]PMD62455.1 hypothetical protein K444DRAFT_610510 [Hyaloscypha bicolor E]